MKRTKLMGVDPGLRNLGVAIYDPKTKKYQLYCGDLFEAIAWVNQNVDLNEVVAVVENPNKTTHLFERWPVVKQAVEAYRQGRHGIGAVQSAYSIATKHAMDVGKNQNTAELFIRLLKRQRVPVIEISPADRETGPTEQAKRKAKKASRTGQTELSIKPKGSVKLCAMPTKTTKVEFEELTGHKGSSNEHSRDAGTLVWNRTIKWAELMLARQASQIHEAPVENGKVFIVDRKKQAHG